MKIKESGENYLETILFIKNKKGTVRSVDLVTELEYTKSSVSRAVNILKDEGYINIDNSGFITFTPRGEERATKIYSKHRIITEFFIKIGVNEEIAENDACRVEHVISDDTFNAISKTLKII